MYEVLQADFTTPRGATVLLHFRADTNDADMLRSCLNEDEYGLRSLELRGMAADIGSHIGGVAVGLLIDNPDLRVIAVEPVPENVELLTTNLAQFGDRALIRLAAAASATDTSVGYSVKFTGDEAAARHHFVANQTMHPQTRSERRSAPAVSLVALVEEFGPLALLVIDCEGCEYAFLDSAAIGSVERIRGEYHRGRRALARLLEATHTLTYDGDEGVGLFFAIRS